MSFAVVRTHGRCTSDDLCLPSLSPFLPRGDAHFSPRLARDASLFDGSFALFALRKLAEFILSHSRKFYRSNVVAAAFV